jgi:hypothetical protein
VCAEAQFGPATADVAVEYMVRLYSFFLLPMIGLLCVDHARARAGGDPLLFCFSFFFFCKKPREKAEKGAREREKVENILSKEKNLGNFGLPFLPFFKKKLRGIF